jgi:hypothetical protein
MPPGGWSPLPWMRGPSGHDVSRPGTGADDLITVRGLDRLLAADVVITDRLAPTGLLSRLGPHVEIIDAARGRATVPGRSPVLPQSRYQRDGAFSGWASGDR